MGIPHKFSLEPCGYNGYTGIFAPCDLEFWLITFLCCLHTLLLCLTHIYGTLSAKNPKCSPGCWYNRPIRPIFALGDLDLRPYILCAQYSFALNICTKFSAIIYSNLKSIAQNVSKIVPKDLFFLVVTLTFDLRPSHFVCTI